MQPYTWLDYCILYKSNLLLALLCVCVGWTAYRHRLLLCLSSTASRNTCVGGGCFEGQETKHNTVRSWLRGQTNQISSPSPFCFCFLLRTETRRSSIFAFPSSICSAASEHLAMTFLCLKHPKPLLAHCTRHFLYFYSCSPKTRCMLCSYVAHVPVLSFEAVCVPHTQPPFLCLLLVIGLMGLEERINGSSI